MIGFRAATLKPYLTFVDPAGTVQRGTIGLSVSGSPLVVTLNWLTNLGVAMLFIYFVGKAIVFKVLGGLEDLGPYLPWVVIVAAL